MKRTLSILLVLVLVASTFSACGLIGKITESESESTPSQSESNESKSDSSDESKKEEKDADVITSLHLLKKEVNYAANRTPEQNRENICKLKYTSFTMAEEDAATYKKLAQILDKAWEQAKEDCSSTFFKICNNQCNYMYDNVMSEAVRADSAVLSILNTHLYWHGGDSYEEKTGLNYDSVTGELLALKDIVKDTEGLAKKMKEKLVDTYGDAYTEKDFLKDTDYFSINADKFTFTIGYEGLTVYFHEVTVNGEWMNATVFYDENPELFKETYTKALENYVVSLDPESFKEVDVDGCGKREVITVNCLPEESYFSWTVNVNGSPIDVKDSAYSGDFYLVKNNGKYYVYIFQTSDNSYEGLAAVDLEKKVFGKAEDRNFGTASCADFWDPEFGENGYHTEAVSYALTDSDAMTLHSRTDLLGNISKIGTYKVGAKGYPEALTKEFTTDGTSIIEAKKDLKCDLVDETGKVIGEGTIKKGKLYYLVRSDYETYADIQIFSGEPANSVSTEEYGTIRQMKEYPGLDKEEKIYRIKIKRGDYWFNVGDEPETDVFSGIAYAG